MKVVGYVRVSTEEQANEGQSVEAQTARIQAFCLAHGHDHLSTFIDAGLSGGRYDNRPDLQKAIETACNHGATLVVYSLSRLSRSTRDTLELFDRLGRCGANIASLTESIDTTSPAGKMVFRMLAVLAEFERDQIIERTKMALSHKRSKGEALGNCPFGYRRDGAMLVEDAGETAALRIILRMAFAGEFPERSYQAIADELNRLGVQTRQVPWNERSVKASQRRGDARVAGLLSLGHSPREVAQSLQNEGYTSPIHRWSRGSVHAILKPYLSGRPLPPWFDSGEVVGGDTFATRRSAV